MAQSVFPKITIESYEFAGLFQQSGSVNSVQREQILLVYDRECPVCKAYSQVVRIRESVGDLVIIDARENTEVLDEITARGLNMDQGMVLKMGERVYYGSAAMNALALISSRSGLFNRVNYYIFKSQTLSSFLYPILKFCRNLLLKVLRKSRINNLGDSGNGKF